MFKNQNIIIFYLVYSSMLCLGFIPSNAPIRYFPKVKGWLTLYTQPADWLTARINCHMDGGFLASPWSPEFTETVLYAAANVQTDKEPIPVLYSGVHTSFAEGALTNAKGIFVLSLKPGDLAALERCGVFFANGTTGEVDCRQRLPYVCYSPDYIAQSEPEVTTKVELDSASATGSTTDELDSSTIGCRERTDTETTTDIQDSSKIMGRATTDSTILKWGTTDSEIESASSLTLKSTCGEESLGYEYSEKTRRCYKFHANAVHTWENARLACEAEGAQLAIVNSDEEAQVLSNLFAKYPREDISGATFLDTAAIGFLKETIWKTIDGDSLTEAGYEKWRPNAPHPAAKYGYICRDGLLYGYISDIKDVPYICEKQSSETDTQQGFQKAEQQSEQKLKLPQFDCGDDSLGYEFEKITGQCYKFHTQVASNWDAAETACEEEGAYLAIVNSDDETHVLVKLFAKYIPEEIPGLINIAAISFPRANAINPWIINHGGTLDEAEYDLSYPHEKEGYFTSRGDLLPYIEYVKDVPFICEKKPVERKPESEGNIEPEVNYEKKMEIEQTTARSNYESTPESGNTEITNGPKSLQDVDKIILNFQRFLTELSQPISKKSIQKQIPQVQIQRTIEEGASQTTEEVSEQDIDQWTDIKTHQESEQKFELPDFDCGAKSLGYEFEEVTGQCYKFHAQVANSWYAAYTACKEEGADLAVVKNDYEAQVLSKLFAKYPPEEIHGTSHPDTAAIGYFKLSTDYPWKTIHGETLEKAGYDMWRPDAPDPLARVGFICRDGLLFGYDAYVRDVPFICEKKPIERKSEVNLEALMESESTTRRLHNEYDGYDVNANYDDPYPEINYD